MREEKKGIISRIAEMINIRYIGSLLLSIILAFIICGFILMIAGYDPFSTYKAMWGGAFDSMRHVGDFLEYAMVLCICGLACVLGARVGIFNVGGEGQLHINRAAVFMLLLCIRFQIERYKDIVVRSAADLDHLAVT